MKPMATRGGTFLGLARAAFEIAQKEAEELDQIDRDLKDGKDGEALSAMRKFFNRKKPATGEKAHDRENDRERRQA
jgi:hypothetical protein